MERQPIGALAIVLLACVGLCSAAPQSLGDYQAKPIGYLRDVSKVSVRYKPEQLINILGFSREGTQSESVVDVLAATTDKDKPKTVANKYSINDLLAINEVYERDFTPEKFQEKLALCASLKPDAKQVPKSAFVAHLIESNQYFKDEISVGEIRKPQEYAFYKNLHSYCMKAFDNYHYLCRLNMKLSDELDGKLMELENEVRSYLDGGPRMYPPLGPGDFESAQRVMEDFLNDKQPEERAQVKGICSDLINRVQFVADRELGGVHLAPIRYKYVHTYCKGALKLD